MNDVQDNHPVLVAYNIIWLCTTTGRGEPTIGRIDIVPLQHEANGNCRPPQEEDGEDLYNMENGSETGSDSTFDETSNADVPPVAKMTWNIPCLAHFYWAPWEATFYCTCNPQNGSFPSMEHGLHPFAMRGMNEWMEMSLLGHQTTVPRIICDGLDDHGHYFLRFEIAWKQQASVSSKSRLYAKRVTGGEDWELSEAEIQRLGISDNISKEQGSVLSATSSGFPNHTVSETGNEEPDRAREQVGRGTPKGRGRRGRRGRRTTSNGSGIFRGKSRGRGSRFRGTRRLGSRGRA